MKDKYHINYSTPRVVRQAGAIAYKNGVMRDDCPIDMRSHPSAPNWWTDGWDEEMAKHNFTIGGKVYYMGEEHEIHDIDEGYGYLALGGDKYAFPNCPSNDCISAPMWKCKAVNK